MRNAILELAITLTTGELLDIERVTSGSEGGRWKSTRKGNSLAAYPTARTVLNGGDGETDPEGVSRPVLPNIWDRQRREWEGQEVPVGRWRFRPIIPLVFYTGLAHWRGETQRSGSGPFGVADLMDLPQALQRFVPHHATLLLNLKETDPGRFAPLQIGKCKLQI